MVRGLLAAGLAVASVVVVVDEVGGASVGWYHQDDHVNLQWVLQYADRPWAALTELHAVHGHVRPGVLLATWGGAMLSAGAWWGPHAVLVGLVVLGLLGLGVLGVQRGGALGGALTVFLALGLAGLPDLLGWNAWVSSAGEIAFGLWALVCAQWALSRERVGGMVLAALCCVVAGSFKEPGWLLYPAVVAALSVGRWRQPVGRAALAVVVVGLVGFVVTFRPENLARAGETAGVVDHLALALGHLVHAWPSPRWELGHHGLGAFLVAMGVAMGVRPLGVTSTGVRPLGVTSTALALTLAAAWLVWPASVWLLVPLLLVALVRAGRTPPVGLLLVVGTLGLSSLTMYASPVYTLTAGFGLALFTASQLATMRGPTGAVLLSIGLVQHGGYLLERSRAPDAPVAEQLASKARVEGLAALVQASGAPRLVLTEGDPELWLVALLGIEVVQDPAARGLTVGHGAVLQPRAGWPDEDLLERAERVRSGGRGVRRRGGARWELALDPGLYGLGETSLKDACGVTHQGPTTFRVDAACSPLVLTDPEAAARAGGYLVALDDPAYDLASGSIPDLLDP